MGNCFDKPDDTEQENQTRHRSPSQPVYHASGPISMTMNGGPKRGDKENIELAERQSYTDQIMGEQDYFTRIVSKTARNLIDVSSHYTPVLREERLMRQKLYTSNKSLRVPLAPLSCFSLPPVSTTAPVGGAVAVLRAPTLISAHNAHRHSGGDAIDVTIEVDDDDDQQQLPHTGKHQPSSQQQQIHHSSARLATAFASIKRVRHCGQVVIPFEEFSADA